VDRVGDGACTSARRWATDRPQENDSLEYVWSNQYDWKIQIVGHTGVDLTHVTVERAGATTAFAVLCAHPDGVLAGAVTVNWPRALVTCRRALTTATSLREVRNMLDK